jgi:predicted PurR-regulated permease PerM
MSSSSVPPPERLYTPPPGSVTSRLYTPPPLRIESEMPPISRSTVAPETVRGRRRALALLLVASTLALLWVASALWVGILLGMVMAFTAQPAYRTLAERFGGRRRRLAAALTTLLYGVSAAVAGVALVVATAREVLAIGRHLQGRLEVGTLSDLVGQRFVRILLGLGLDDAKVMGRLRGEVGRWSNQAAEAAGLVLSTTTGLVVGFVIALFTMYYVLLQWWNVTLRLERVLPLDPAHTRALMIEFRDVGRSAFVGTIATAAIQGVFAGIGYAAAGVPQAFGWALATTLASFIPLFGTSLVWGPVAAWLAAHDRFPAAIFVLAWGVVVVTSLTDYWIRPRLVGAQKHGHPLLMLVSLLGGFEVMGLAGLIVAPMIASLFLAVFNIYERALAGPADGGRESGG